MELIDQRIINITPNYVCNGCGTKRTGKLFPDKFGTVDFTAACNIHDAHYYHLACEKRMHALWRNEYAIFKRLERGGRRYADYTFRRNMIITNKESGSLLVRLVIEAYFVGTRIFGGFCIRN